MSRERLFGLTSFQSAGHTPVMVSKHQLHPQAPEASQGQRLSALKYVVICETNS